MHYRARVFTHIMLLAIFTIVIGLIGLSMTDSFPVQVHFMGNADEDVPYRETTASYSIYEDSVRYLYVVVKDGEHSFEYINEIPLEQSLSENPMVDIRMSEGDQTGPYDLINDYSEGTIQLRGYSSRAAEQKSYKIRLDKGQSFLGQDIINLNKHYDDPLRIANKFSYDMLKLIPDLSALNTYFVNLYVLDETKGETEFTSYGLYTMVEQPGSDYVEDRGLGSSSTLYKAIYFPFSEDLIDRLQDEEQYDSLVEVIQNPDDDKLIEMLEDLHSDMNINEVFDEHFNRDNYLSWVALNIIIGNIDATAGNFILYSPNQSDTWYFIPWDMDKSLAYTERQFVYHASEPQSYKGLSTFWGVPLHREFFSEDGNIDLLIEKVDEMMEEYFTQEQVYSLTDFYKEVAEEYMTQIPDVDYLKISEEQLLYDIEHLYGQLVRNVAAFKETLEYPMPIYMSLAEKNGNIYSFWWEESIDFQGDEITYIFEIATDSEFNEVIFRSEQQELGETVDVTTFPDGVYYHRVLIQDEHGNVQTNLEYYSDPLDGTTLRHALAFVIGEEE